MRKYIESFTLVMLSLLMFSACSEDAGTDPGTDGTPVATVYQYTAPSPYNSDNDCFLRIAANSAVKEVYYLAQLTTDKEALNMDDAQYADYVVSKGKAMDVKAGSAADVYITDLHGSYTIGVVAVNGNTKTLRTTTFDGLDYKPWGTGTYTSDFFGDSWKVNIEHSDIGDRYRIKDNWYEGYGFAWSYEGKNVTVYPTTFETGYVHSKYGMVSATDQGSTYDEKKKTFTFNFKWTVSAGSFGVYAEYLTLDN